MIELGKALRNARESRNIKQQELAELMYCDISTISHYENERRTPNIHVLVQMADALNMSLDTLVGRKYNG